MTGTAKTEEEEFRKIYNMRVVVFQQTNSNRIDALDYVYARKGPKLAALIKEVKERHEKGQPILIGTVSVESSEEISALLTQAGLRHEMLNAKNHAREAEIISHAGEKGAITLATNMAGRGTDIKISDEVRALGGLCVSALKGTNLVVLIINYVVEVGVKAIRLLQILCFFEDTLLVRFAADSIKNYIEKNFGDDPLEARMITNVITSTKENRRSKL